MDVDNLIGFIERVSRNTNQRNSDIVRSKMDLLDKNRDGLIEREDFEEFYRSCAENPGT
jgi:Ca2+-binding EF-hand superfamily protein